MCAKEPSVAVGLPVSPSRGRERGPVDWLHRLHGCRTELEVASGYRNGVDSTEPSPRSQKADVERGGGGEGDRGERDAEASVRHREKC